MQGDAEFVKIAVAVASVSKHLISSCPRRKLAIQLDEFAHCIGEAGDKCFARNVREWMKLNFGFGMD